MAFVSAFQPILCLFLSTLLLLQISALNTENFNAVYGNSPAPFRIDVHPSFIADTAQKASLTRYVDDIDIPDFADGPPRHNATSIRDYWVNKYNWFDVQRRLNQKYKQFTTTVTLGSDSNYTDPIPLHFVHHRSPRADATPLLFIHGWPGSFLEVGNIIDGLTNPPNPSFPAFHVVAPSIPGFGFSPAPEKPGLGARGSGHAFNALMQQLNYPHYVIQAGDLGGIVLRYIAGDYPSAVTSVLSNFWVVPPNATDLQRFSQGLATPDESTLIQVLNLYVMERSGYRFIQETRPLQVASAMTDSPVGFTMWIYDLMQFAVQHYVWQPEEIITWSMMYYIQGPYGGFRFYKELRLEGGGFSSTGASTIPFVHQPVAISEFPQDLWYGTPLDWAQRVGNVIVRNVHTSGGHFAALESPDILLTDMREFWKKGGLGGL